MRSLLVVCLVAAACDTRATASDPQGGGGRAEQKSREYESCGASLHCQDNLRCFDHTCRRIKRSNVGDYFAALGAAQRTRGDLEAAIASYAQALAHYDADKAAGNLPPDVDCAYGATLAAARSKKEHAELAARVLHRCILSVPVGSALRDQALAQLALLEDNGIDPLLLGADHVADLYLTKGPKKPASDKVTVTVSASPATSSKTYAALSEKLNAPDAKPGLIACWEAYTQATKKEALAVTIGVKSAYVQDPNFPDEGGAYVIKLDKDTPNPATPDGAAQACVRALVEPIAKGLKASDSFSTKLTVALK
jgi:hypothetical protein